MKFFRFEFQADPYILCKIYDKESCCPKYTDTSIRALRKRLFERQLGSHPDQTNSQFDNMNQSQTQFDDSNFPKDVKQSTFPPLENIPPESILPNLGPPIAMSMLASPICFQCLMNTLICNQLCLLLFIEKKNKKKQLCLLLFIGKKKNNNFAYF